MDHHHLKTPLLQNQPMIIIKTFPLQMLLTLICFFAESKMCLWLINALRNDLLVVFKEIKPAAHFKILFLGLFAQERKFVQLCSAAGGKSSNVCAWQGLLEPVADSIIYRVAMELYSFKDESWYMEEEPSELA